MSEMVFMMGSPAAGKSTTAENLFGGTHVLLDCDAIKASHPDYDPKAPHLLHAWSGAELDRLFHAAIDCGAGNWVLDGTGANAERLVFDMKLAREAGFAIRLVYVRCSLETSLRRNAKRERHVPEDVVRSKYELIETSFELVSPYVDSIQVIENDVDLDPYWIGKATEPQDFDEGEYFGEVAQ